MKIAIIGTVGVPGRYGGFETLAENLVLHAEGRPGLECDLTVYCSRQAYPEGTESYHGAALRYSRFGANGPQSVVYDFVTALDAAFRQIDLLLLLGVSGAMVAPLLRLFSKSKVVIHVDGVEWRRDKWRGFAKRYLKWSEVVAVRYAHVVIADNQGIADYLDEEYGIKTAVIAYGGDHAMSPKHGIASVPVDLPKEYALALCRIEPENNIEMILSAFENVSLPLVFVGNWESSDYGTKLRAKFADRPNLHLRNPIYEPGPLYAIRRGACIYVHGHSAGGTNPALVEMMHFGVPVFAHRNAFNRYTSEDKAIYFDKSSELREALNALGTEEVSRIGADMKEIASRRYTWSKIGDAYFNLLKSVGE